MVTKKRGGQRKLSGRHSACFTIDARTASALEALVDAGATSKSEVVRRAVALLAEMEIPAWRYKPPVDPRQLEIEATKKITNPLDDSPNASYNVFITERRPRAAGRQEGPKPTASHPTPSKSAGRQEGPKTGRVGAGRTYDDEPEPDGSR